MHFSVVTLAALSTSVLATQGLISHQSFSAMLRRGEALSKRQGYYPDGSGTPCSGTGTTCEEVCGATYNECSSTEGRGLCFEPSTGAQCCSGTGKVCDPGYYCTRDAAGIPYCCVENVSAEQCAREYGVDGTLIPDSATPAVPSPTESPEIPSASDAESYTEEPPSFTSEDISPTETAEPETTEAPYPSTGASNKPTLPNVFPTGGYSSRTLTPNPSSVSSALPQFTGGAALRSCGQGALMLAGAAGLVML